MKQVVEVNYSQKCAKQLTMTLNQLKYIVAVARERNFGRAADAWSYSASYAVGAVVSAAVVPFFALARRERAESDEIIRS